MHTRQATADYVTIGEHRIPTRPHSISNTNETANTLSNHYTHLCTDNRDYLSVYACVDRIEEASESSSLILGSNSKAYD